MSSFCFAGMKDEYDMIEKGNKCEDFSKDLKIELFTTRKPAAATLKMLSSLSFSL